MRKANTFFPLDYPSPTACTDWWFYVPMLLGIKGGNYKSKKRLPKAKIKVRLFCTMNV